MQKKTIWIVIAVIILIGLGFFLSRGSIGVDQTKSEGDQTAAQTETSTAGSPMSLKSLLGMNTSQVCTFSMDTESVKTSGTVHVANGKVRGDFQSQTEGGAISSHMISDGQYVNIWTDSMAQGFRMKIDAGATASANSNVPDFDQKMNYNCKPGSVEASLFVPPTTIKFTEMSSTGSAGASAMQCSSCDQIPAGSGREQCRAALSCK